MKRNACLLLVVWTALTGLSAGLADEAKSPHPSFVFFLVDDLGWTDVGCFGSTFYETPNLDRLARPGHAVHATPTPPARSARPTRASILTGQYPQRVGITDYIEPARQPGGELEAQHAAAAGPYRDRLALERSPRRGPESGRLRHVLRRQMAPRPRRVLAGGPGLRHQHGRHANGAARTAVTSISRPTATRGWQTGRPGEHLPDRLATETVQFIEANKDRPFLAYLSFYSVHTPLMAREDLQEVRGEGQDRDGLGPNAGAASENAQVRLVQDHAVYAGMVEAMDQAVGKVLDALDRLGSGRQHGRGLHVRQRRAIHLRRASRPEPAAARRQGLALRRRHPRADDHPLARRDHAGQHVRHARDQHRLLPDHARHRRAAPAPGPAPGRRQPRARSCAAATSRIAARSSGTTRITATRAAHPAAAIRVGDWKLIEWFEDGRLELFNLREDVGERHDLAGAVPERAQMLRDKLHAWQKEVGALMPSRNPQKVADP